MVKRIIFIIIASAAYLSAAAQSDSKAVRLRYNDALGYFQGIYKPYYPALAFNIFLELAEEGYPRAMNSVALMYSEGTGTEQDYAKAFSWFEKAASAGYNKAYFNLGLIWKYGYGVSPDEAKALESYRAGAMNGDPHCQYALGYMSYKGLACEQDYGKALEMFFEAADSGNTAAMFMIGVCYRNGYGITRDEAKGIEWLEKSAREGNIRALRELSAIEAENRYTGDNSLSGILKNNNLPETYTAVEHDLNGIDIEGSYNGYIVTYDWSGDNVVSLNPLKLSLKTDGSKIKGFWTEADTSIAEIDASVTDSSLIFNNVSYSRISHYYASSLQYDFRTAAIRVTKYDSLTLLTGNLQFFSPVTMEPEKPVYVSLIRKDFKEKPEPPDPSGKQIYDLLAFPNPFLDRINISFILKNESEVSAMLYTTDGRLLYKNDFGKLSAGSNIQQLNMNLPYGIFVLKVACGAASAKTIIVK